MQNFQQPTLKRELGKFESYAIIIGSLIGAGIFVVTGQAGGIAGPGVPFAYLLMLPVILSTAMAYAVFMSTPLGNEPGGAYTHISRTFNNYFLGFIVMWLKLVSFFGVMSIMSLSFADYLTPYFPGLDSRIVATIVILGFYVIHVMGVKEFGRFQAIIFSILVLAILVLVVPGLFHIKLEYYADPLPFGWKAFFSVFPTLFLSYLGFESLAQAAGETKNAREVLPKVFLVGIILTATIYFLISFVAFGVLPFDILAQSSSAMTDVASVYLPLGAAGLVSIGAIMAFVSTINTAIMVPSRVMMMFANDRLAPQFFARINPKTHTPVLGLTLTVLIVLFLIWTGTMEFILGFTLQGMFILYMMHSLTMICLPFVNPQLYQSARFRPHPAILVIGGLISVGTLFAFSYAIIMDVWKLLVFWVALGVIIYGSARFAGKREQYDYKAAMGATKQEYAQPVR